MASIGGGNSAAASDFDPNKNYTVPLILMVGLFFMIGFITVLNDVLAPNLKELFKFETWISWGLRVFSFWVIGSK